MDVRRISTIAFALAVPGCFSPNTPVGEDASDTDAPSTTTTGVAGSETGDPPGDDDTGTTVVPDPTTMTGSTMPDETTTGEGMDDTSTSDDTGTTGEPDPVAECGNGLVEAEEDCDDAELNGVSGMSDCLADCTLTTCGDGFSGLPETEECDQGDDNAEDAACTAACAIAVCGDELVGPGESCDDGVRGSELCTPGCALASCGDGIIQAGEDCDDENGVSTDACVNCVSASCGDGFVEAAEEQCDDGAGNASEPVVCAYGVTDDDCTYCAASSCSVEQGITSFCGDGEVQAGSGEDCDDGEGNLSTAPTCGYGVEKADCTYCDATSCSSEVGITSYCGDGVLQAGQGEACDDGDEVQGNGCNDDCVPSGLELWTYEEHVSQEDACVDLVAAESGHLYMVGQVDNLSGADDADIFYVQRLSNDGTLDWTREYAPFATPTEHDYDPFVATDVGDGVVVSGAHREGTTLFFTYTDVPTVKFSAVNGDVVWDRTDDFVQFAGGLAQDEDGELVVAGTTVNDYNVFLYRLSADGDLIGNTAYVEGRRARGLAYQSDDTFIVGLEFQGGGNPAVLQRRNAGFGLLWEVEPEGLSNVRGVTAAADGDAIAVGGQWVGRFGSPDGADAWVVDTGKAATLGTPAGVAATLDGGAFVVGVRQGSPWIARLEPDGSTRWSRTSSESGEFSSVDVDADGAPIACGTVDGGSQGDNIFVARYTQ